MIGPDQIPKITDLLQAVAQPELATLSAIVHGQSEEGFTVLQTFFDSLEHLPDELESYADLVLSLLPEVIVAKFMEFTMVMGTRREPRSTWVRRWLAEAEAEGKAEGEAEGEAKAILRILKKRGIPVSDEAAERIFACNDTEILETWIDRAITAHSVDALFK
ncbi:MAG: hypothetical protein HOW71_34250 [Nonomuraea sp.]|nr:hypothetical protein [Nonomuraea sp.]